MTNEHAHCTLRIFEMFSECNPFKSWKGTGKDIFHARTSTCTADCTNSI
jgi:hypothetical protein